MIASGAKTSGFSRSDYEAGIFPRGVFKAPATGTNGNEGPNAFRNPGYLGLNASAIKRVALPWFHDQASAFTFRVEALNLLNRTNLQGVSANTGDTFFGRATSANPPRIFQLGARFEF